MSRIHEALKKAEQERAANPGEATHSGLETPEASVLMDEALLGSRNVAAIHTSSTAAMPGFASPFSLEALLERSTQVEWKPDPATMLFLNGAEDSARGTEEFRTLRSRLHHTRERMPLKKVLVTSALPKEGKSFTSANLALVMARQHGRRVLLIDADLRAPRLHLMLGTTASPGLSEYLQGQNDEFSIMQRGPLDNLFLIPSGAGHGNPAELVANGRLKYLLQRVESLFDWIIIDSPPAVPVSDAGILAKACDGVLMVVRSDATPFDMARRARREFPDQALIGIVLNGTREESAPYSRYYYEAYANKGNGAKS
jgi:protein-tyrosine kinase